MGGQKKCSKKGRFPSKMGELESMFISGVLDKVTNTKK